MEKYFTPLNIEALKQSFNGKKENKSSNTVLLLIATLTAAVLAVMLLILIQKKISTNNLNSNPIENDIIISPTVIQSPTIIPVISESVQQYSSSQSGTIEPTREITITPTDEMVSPPASSDANNKTTTPTGDIKL